MGNDEPINDVASIVSSSSHSCSWYTERDGIFNDPVWEGTDTAILEGGGRVVGMDDGPEDIDDRILDL